MKGEELQRVVNNSGIKISAILEKTGITKSTFYSLYKKATIEDYYLQLLNTAGLNVQKSSTVSQFQLQENENLYYKLKVDVNTLSQIQDLQKELIKASSARIATLEDQVKSLTNQLNYYEKRMQNVPDNFLAKKVKRD